MYKDGVSSRRGEGGHYLERLFSKPTPFPVALLIRIQLKGEEVGR